MTFPNILFVREETDTDGTKFFVTFRTPQEAVIEDGPTRVGTYKRIGVRRLAKILLGVHNKSPRRQKGKRDA